jgi:membrane protein DedA with SNARE-associated domain
MALWFLNSVNTPGFSEMARSLGYVGIFLFFITIDQLTPIPEEVTLLSIGYLAAAGTFNPFIAGAVAMLACVLVDTGYFFLARSGNKFFQKLYKKTHRPFMDKYKNNLHEHLPRTLIVLCFIPRMRMFGPIFCGLLKIKYKKFIIYDIIGIASFTALYVAIGTIFGHTIRFDDFKNYIVAGAILVIGGMVFWFIHRVRNHKKASKA